ncbi:hypothetical protein EUGRSUZ_L02161 [Eucalyptus grandis]|uniref:Uncharacterized protein n=1 Tax=Eucalyptus grandis TaxID=71139 RepID=A0A058ZRF7_EUCGR|nr:hypothetical protein EUGRSUZ_L02161 [Eucalyptus grandis]
MCKYGQIKQEKYNRADKASGKGGKKILTFFTYEISFLERFIHRLGKSSFADINAHNRIKYSYGISQPGKD